jgi:hypothetical protein
MAKRTLDNPEPTNADRAEWAADALRHFQCTTGTDDEDALVDLLADLIHWADRQSFDFALDIARMHYEAEMELERAPDAPAAPRKFRVSYAVTRTEHYEIEAKTEKEAEERGFDDGKQIEDSGETTDIVPCDVEEVAP